MTATLSQSAIDAIVGSHHGDVFSVLGPHQNADGQPLVRAFIPGAKAITVVATDSGDTVGELTKIHGDGLYEGTVQLQPGMPYKLNVDGDFGPVLIEDCYRFPSQIHEHDLYLFGEGNNEKAYEFLGAHLTTICGVQGCRFAVWAPNACRVSVLGDFNFWDGRRHVMRKLVPSGVWEIFIPGVDAGACYKYELKDQHGHLLPHKADPFGFAAQRAPEQASVVADVDSYQWQDQHWMQNRAEHARVNSAISIYEVHLGSWKRKVEDNFRSLSYHELAEDLIPYTKSMGFTHLQLMPISEYPFDGSWGYQPIGLYAPTSRFGSPDDFKYFVDQCHQAGLGVLIDWVPGHFPTDAHGLGRFDGTPLYEHADARQGFHPDWNTYIFNYGRREVANYLMANALFWFDKFHIDGLRVDAVASMLYLDYSRNAGEWIANQFGGRENLDAIDFIKNTNERVYKRFPDVMMIAEESTAWPGVSQPTFAGGLGFGFKWNMGWMNDSLKYISRDPVHRRYHHHSLTFGLLYAFTENFILPLSHDEVVHGKRSILGRMPGDTWQQFANVRAYYAFMWTHPGKQLLFMGDEFAQGPEWDHDSSVCWHQLEVPEHAGVQRLIRDLNTYYRSSPALFDGDAAPEGFEWIEADDHQNSIFIYLRKSLNTGAQVLVVCNMTPVLREQYRVGVSLPGPYREVINTDAEIYGGSNAGNAGLVVSEHSPAHGREHSMLITVPPLATVIFEYAP